MFNESLTAELRNDRLRVPDIIMSNDNARARRTDPLESHLSADATARQVKESQDVVEAILLNSPTPLDDLQIEQRAHTLGGKRSGSRYRTARDELRALGRVQSAGNHRAPNHEGKLSTHGLWRHAKYNDHFEHCYGCGREHWFRTTNTDPRDVELIGPCGFSVNIRIYGEDE